jgi:hypothetical protein
LMNDRRVAIGENCSGSPPALSRTGLLIAVPYG